MPEEQTAAPEFAMPEAAQPTSTRAAIARCCDAYEQTRRAHEKKRGETAAHYLASEAYRKAMPQLTAPASIPDFIACVAHGMLIEAIEAAQGTRLLYAARTAQAAFRKLAADSSKPA